MVPKVFNVESSVKDSIWEHGIIFSIEVNWRQPQSLTMRQIIRGCRFDPSVVNIEIGQTVAGEYVTALFSAISGHVRWARISANLKRAGIPAALAKASGRTAF